MYYLENEIKIYPFIYQFAYEDKHIQKVFFNNCVSTSASFQIPEGFSLGSSFLLYEKHTFQ